MDPPSSQKEQASKQQASKDQDNAINTMVINNKDNSSLLDRSQLSRDAIIQQISKSIIIKELPQNVNWSTKLKKKSQGRKDVIIVSFCLITRTFLTMREFFSFLRINIFAMYFQLIMIEKCQINLFTRLSNHISLDFYCRIE